MVKFPIELDQNDLLAAIRLITGIVGWDTWRRRIEPLENELKSNPFWEPFLLERHGIELTFGKVKRRLKLTGRCPFPPSTYELYRLYSFLAVVVRTHRFLSPHGQKRLAGRLRSALDSECGLGPLAFEMTVVAHLMSRGFDVDFHDLESGGGGYDFLARLAESEIELECKHVSADIGRKIHRRKLHALGALMRPLLVEAVNQGVDGRLIRVTLPDRLTGNRQGQQALLERIGSVLLGDTRTIEDVVCSVTCETFSLHTTPFSNAAQMREVRDYIYTAFNIENSHVLLNWRPGKAAAVVSFQSQKRDRVLEELLDHLKGDAKRQFSRVLPGMLCVHLADVNQAQLRELAHLDRSGTPTGLQRGISNLLQRRPHLHSVAVMVDGEVLATQTPSVSSWQETGSCYVIANPEHPMARHPAFEQLFRRDGGKRWAPQ